jgi:hypothetical protein
VGEIKSTIELAMERTKKFAISEREREEIKQREVLQKATAFFHRYREGHLPLNDILKQIERMEKKTATKVREYLLSQWIDSLSLDDEEDKIFKGIESLGQGNIDKVKQKYHSLVSQYREEKEKIKEMVGAQRREILRMGGISGSAVEPNLEEDELWIKEDEKLGHFYKATLDEIKEQLRGL